MSGVFWTWGILAWTCWLKYLNLKTRSWKLSWKSDGFSRYFGFWVISDFNCGFSCACFVAGLEYSAIQHCPTEDTQLYPCPQQLRHRLWTSWPCFALHPNTGLNPEDWHAGLGGCGWRRTWVQWHQHSSGWLITYCVWEHTCVCSPCHVCGGQKTA